MRSGTWHEDGLSHLKTVNSVILGQSRMQALALFAEIIDTYQRHGWELRRVLLRPEARAALNESSQRLFKDALLVDSDFDALWFSRPSHAGREAWELRQVAAQPYALFEAFEAGEDEGLREDARREMENRMRDQLRQT